MPEHIMDEGQFKGYEDAGARVCQRCNVNGVGTGRIYGFLDENGMEVQVGCPACGGTGREESDAVDVR